MAVHVDILAPGHDADVFLSCFPGIEVVSRGEQKRIGRLTVAKYLHDRDFLSDPKTEALELL